MINATLEARVARIIDLKGVTATERAAQILALPEMEPVGEDEYQTLQRLGRMALQRMLAQAQEAQTEVRHGCRS